MIVSFNTREKLRRCLSCVEPDYEVIVVDNNSGDGSADMVAADFPKVHLIRNPKNEGFGAANNVGASVATREWVLFLNSDAYAKPGAIARLATDAGDAVCAGGRLLNLDGTIQESVAGPLTLWNVFLEQTMLEKLAKRYWRTPHGNDIVEVEQVMGAAMLVRREHARFDERFFMYCEDTELCLRLRKLGRIVYCPQAEFEHELGSSSADRRWLAVARYNRGKELFFSIHRGIGARIACEIMDKAGAMLRLVIWSVLTAASLGRSAAQVRLFWRVLTARSVDIDPRA